MSLLFKHLRVHQVFGANTDVGKTILTSALVRASALRNSVFYLKPVSTGPIQDADDRHVKRFGGSGSRIQADCLYRFDEPVSPHLAAKLSLGAEHEVPSDETFVNSIANYVRTNAARCGDSAHMYVETAGGVHSPTLSGTTQVDCYRPLFLPTILVGDSKLGGISATISSYESLLLRGYIIDAVLLFRDDYYRNWEYLQPYFAERGVHLSAVDAPPPLLEDSAENYTSTEKYYDTIVPQNSTDIHQDGIFSTLQHLDLCHTGRLQELESMPRRTLDSVWWPFVQHGLVSGEKDVTVIDSAYSDFFSVHKPEASGTDKELPPITSSLLKPEFDGSASWWTQTFGHAHPSLTLAAARASGRYGHVMFPQATHLPALKLAERLLQGPGAGWASRAFFSDDGSTGMEIALKMALRAFTLRQGQELDSSQKKELGILGIKGSYHGDTIGAMDACEEGVYTCEWHNAKGYWFDPPTVSIQEGKVVISLPPAIADSTTMSADAIPAGSISWAYDVSARLQTPLARTYRSYIKSALENLERRGGPKLAALVIEPILMGAGGMIFVDPLFQRVLIDVVRQESSTPSSQWSGLPVIFDEVFVGLYRIGMQSTGPLLGAYPDISVNAKVLTGGLIPLAITMASDSIFQAFLSDKKADALLHGHSYTAHPIGCEVANETLQLIDKLVSSDHWKGAQKKWETPDGTPGLVWSLWNPHFINRISWLPMVDKVMALGSVLAIQMKDDSGYSYVAGSAEQMLQSIRTTDNNPHVSSAPGGASFGVHFRTLGNVAYFMSSLNTSPTIIQSIEDRIWQALNEYDHRQKQ